MRSCKDIKSLTSELRYNSGLSFEKLISKIIGYIDFDNEDADKQTRVLCIQLLRNFVELDIFELIYHNHVDYQDAKSKRKFLSESYKPMLDWSVENWNDQVIALGLQQEKLAEFDLVEMLCKLYVQSDDLEIEKELILLATTLLYEGNEVVQKKFMEVGYFVSRLTSRYF